MEEHRSAALPLRNAISNAMSRIKRDHYGRGPARARTYLFDRYVFSVLDDVLTPAEQALKDSGRAGLVRRTRLTFQEVMTEAFTGAVEELTGSAVIGYHSQIVFDPDMAFEVFVLDQPPGRDGDGGEPARPGDGRLRASIADSLSRVLHQNWGKGPTGARVFLEDQFVFCVLEDPFTTVERTLLDSGEKDLVRKLRIEFHEAQRAAFEDNVARETGRRVDTSLAQVVYDPDLLILCFLLGEPVSEGEVGVG